MPGDPECEYYFFVDAKHERYCEVDGPIEGMQDRDFSGWELAPQNESPIAPFPRTASQRLPWSKRNGRLRLRVRGSALEV